MGVGIRLRLSLVGRMCVALGILAALGIVLAVVVGVLGGLVGFFAVAYLMGILEYVAGAPRPSTISPVPAGAVAIAASAALVGAVYGWPHISAHTREDNLVPPTGPTSAVLLVVALCSGYLLLVEGSAAVLTLLGWVLAIENSFLVLFVASGLLVLVGTVEEARREVDRLQDRLLEDSEPAAERQTAVAEATRRLAQLADVPPPEVRITDTARPESFTVGTGADAVVVVSTGLVEALSTAELEAVLAHEVSHLANADGRVVSLALVPTLAADDWITDRPRRSGDYFWNGVFGVLKRIGQFGVAFLSRGREWSADAGAVALTGSPAALASALATIEGRRRTPATDLREWESSIAALDILPAVDDHAGPFRTHPPTEARIERLRRLEAAAEWG